jgi:three-Cys-motif partner protein
MDQKKNEQIQKFGGAWTVIKIDILKQYLDAYTTALKSQPFNLVYIDAFAGCGKYTTKNDQQDMPLL